VNLTYLGGWLEGVIQEYQASIFSEDDFLGRTNSFSWKKDGVMRYPEFRKQAILRHFPEVLAENQKTNP